MLTLETGVGLPDSDSLVSLAEVRAYASSRGKVVSAVDADLEPQVRTAHDYLRQHETKFQGYRRTEGQALPFPRSGLNVFGRTVAEGLIPKLVKDAVCQLVIEQLDRDLLPAVDARVVVSETVGPISTTYSNTGATTANPVLPVVDALLAPLFRNGGARLSVARA